MNASVNQRLKTQALENGFDAVAICPAKLPGQAGHHLRQFVEAGHHGSMAWMEQRIEQRASPDQLWPAARSVIMLMANYGPDHNPMAKLSLTDRGNISVYAQNRDYHDLIKKRLKKTARWMVAEFSCAVKVFVDTAPVMEKPLAQQAGLGWQGKHTNLVSRSHGSWMFLGSIFTDLELAFDRPETDHCGQCQACLDICPTRAFPAPYKIDARRCISYLTIEHKGEIPEEFRKAMGNRIYGCDDCLSVCPWNKFAQTTQEMAFHPRDELRAPVLAELAMLDDQSFRNFFSGSPVKRIGRDRFIRNVLIAIGNSGAPYLLPVAKHLCNDPCDYVAEAARWAIAQLEGDQH